MKRTKRFADGGLQRGRAYVSPQERQRQYYLRNPEPGLESVGVEDLFMPGSKVRGAKQVMSKVSSGGIDDLVKKLMGGAAKRERKPGAWRSAEAKQKADREMRQRIKEAELRKSGKASHEEAATYTSPDTIEGTARTTKRAVNPDIADVERDVASKFDEYRKGGKVKSRSSASTRADGIARKGKTRGRIV